jgi:hypothetical protein
MNKEGGPNKVGHSRASDWGAADCLSLAAAPDASPLTGMIPMYGLMSAFHAAPWLKPISNRTSTSP